MEMLMFKALNPAGDIERGRVDTVLWTHVATEVECSDLHCG
jgi:hypothetical protein